MPLPTDEEILALSQKIIDEFDKAFGVHPGFRPAHAKGTMLSGGFTPVAAAASLTRAPHMHRPRTPVTVRFSNSTGLPALKDNDPNADPRGMAVRFHLAEHQHTDVICHTADGFPTRTADEFLELLRAAAASDMSKPSDPAAPKPIEKFLAAHPETLAFVQMPKPAPSSFARATYFGPTAVRFTNQSGANRFGRYRLVPAAGNEHLDAAALSKKGPNYLFDELKERIAKGPIEFRLMVQLANDGDVVDNATIHWPADRTVMELGRLLLTEPIADDAAEQKQIIFDPIPRIDGIEPSGDPLFEVRAAVYLISGRRRRAAKA